MTTAADNNGTQDWVADSKGEGGEQAANNNGIRARAPGRESDKIKKSSLCKKTFSAIRSVRLDFCSCQNTQYVVLDLSVSCKLVFPFSLVEARTKISEILLW